MKLLLNLLFRVGILFFAFEIIASEKPTDNPDFYRDDNSRIAAENIMRAIPELCNSDNPECKIALGPAFFEGAKFTRNRNYPYNPDVLTATIKENTPTFEVTFVKLAPHDHIISIVFRPEGLNLLPKK